jgi:broad specificity phosphatase PhoE
LTTFYLVRHGTTAWVEKQLLHGVTDIPLNDNGLRQAAKAAEALKGVSAKHLLCSPLSRAMQSAEAIGQSVGLTPELRQGLIEINFGWKEGRKTLDDTDPNIPPVIEKLDHYWLCLIRLVSGESQGHFRERIRREWEAIRSDAGEENTIIVSHAGVLSVILELCFGAAYRGSYSYYVTYPCSISEIAIDADGQCKLVRLNDYSHLKEWYPDGH